MHGIPVTPEPRSGRAGGTASQSNKRYNPCILRTGKTRTYALAELCKN